MKHANFEGGNRLRHAAATALAAVIITAVPAAQANPYEKTLSNGLKVVVKEDHRAPVVVSQIWYRIGSMDELNGITGISHALEHMMFKGTGEIAPGEFSRIIAAAGGRENAFTGKDYTAYFQQLHKSKLPLAMRLEADRMRNLTLPADEFEKEIKVVIEERRLRTEDQPRSLVYERLMATAYKAHPYRRPIIGWMSDLENMKVGDLRDWYRRWYSPNNATLVVVGDVKAEEVFKLAERHYGKAKPSKLPERKPQDEPPQRGVQRVTVKAPAELPYVLMAYHAPVVRDPLKDWEPFALEILAGILDGHAAARLNRALVRERQVANSAGAGYDSTGRGPGMFLLEGTPRPGHSAADIEAGLKDEVAKIVRDGVTEEELNRVKSQVVAAHIFGRDSVFYQAMQIGQLESSGLSYRHLDLLIARLKEVTAEQVREVARKYLVDDNLTVAVLEPQPLEGKPRAAPPAGGRHGG